MPPVTCPKCGASEKHLEPSETYLQNGPKVQQIKCHSCGFLAVRPMAEKDYRSLMRGRKRRPAKVTASTQEDTPKVRPELEPRRLCSNPGCLGTYVFSALELCSSCANKVHKLQYKQRRWAEKHAAQLAQEGRAV